MLTLNQSEDFRPEGSYVIWAMMDSEKKMLHLYLVREVWLTIVDEMDVNYILYEMIVPIY